MCGIAGILSFKDKVSERDIKGMLKSLVHRGPDDEGIWISRDRKIALGHRRLAIIDLSPKAKQPMSSEDNSVWIVFNGEIYNFMDIRRELEDKGHRWKTDHSDTEVIIHAYEEWGLDCIHKLRGMFAFAIWDNNKKELSLVRDRLGIKPLYYTFQNGKFIFASEIKAILSLNFIERHLNSRAFYDYLSFLASPAPDTLFEGIKKLPPATWMKVRADGNVRIQKYWDVWDHTNPMLNKSEEEISEILLDKLRESVKLRKISDVPVGVFLSGGIDSSTNAVLFSEDEKTQVKTFSIGYDSDYDTYKNEFKYARLIAKKIKSNHYEKKLTVDDLLNFLDKLIYYQDEPIGDPVCIPVYYVSKLARDNGVIVCQVGEGADELFIGYPYWLSVIKLHELDKLPIPRITKKSLQFILESLGKSNKRYFELLKRANEGVPIFWSGAEAFTEIEKRKLLSPDFLDKFQDYTSFYSIESIYKRFLNNAWDKSFINWMTYIDLNLRLPEVLLMRVDKMSMAVSLEARVPFLDHKFVEFSMSIPSYIKVKNGETKYILKKTVGKLLPKEIVFRKKQGFGLPVYEWMFGKLGSFTKLKINEFNKKYNIFNSSFLNYLYKKKSAQLWYILNFVLWYEKWIEKSN